MRLLPALLLTATAAAQIPDRFTNLQVLRKDIPKQELTSMMRGLAFSLGVRCVNCHDAADYASDAKEAKKKARVMMRMVEVLNRDTIAMLEPATATRVDCATCHHGLDKPRALQNMVAEELDKKDLASAIAFYRDLRKRYYGGAQYDFSETSLNLLVESLGAKKTKASMLTRTTRGQSSNSRRSSPARSEVAPHAYALRPRRVAASARARRSAALRANSA